MIGLGLTATPPARSLAGPVSETPQWRPELHFTPRRNWMNDPNGLVFYEGEYHLFFQHNPASTEHGNLSWGHAVSTELTRWEELPVALEPDELGEIYSGSAVVDHHDTSGFFGGRSGLVAIYTSAGETQQQSIAHSSDRGRTWTKYDGNPVIPNPGVEDFRDPKVIRHEPSGQWVLLLAAGDRIEFYGSPDLKHWSRLGEFGADHGSHGGVWECPDVFELPVDGDASRSRWVLVVSINPGGPAGGSATQYFVGDFDGTTFTSDDPADQVLWVDEAADFYAPQSWSDVPGRRLWIGWMSNWDYAGQLPTDPWLGAMTVPRQLELVTTDGGIRLAQKPVDELAARRGDPRRWSGTVSDAGGGPEFRGAALDVVVECELDTASAFGFDVFVGPGQRTRIGYDAVRAELFLDRTGSGRVDFAPEFPARHSSSLSLDGSGTTLRMRVLLDRSGVEVFADRGQAVLTDLVFPDPEGDGLALFAEGGQVRVTSLEVFTLR